MINKKCNVCHTIKPLHKFPKCKSCRDGHNNYCRKCKKRKSYNVNWSRYSANYGMNGFNKIKYDDMILNQNGICLICKCSHYNLKYGLCIDHCHKSGIVRGLLCNKCNVGLGFFADNIDNLKRAIKYLERSI